MPDTPNDLRDLRRAQVVAAGRKLVADQGLSALTFANLEGAMGQSRGVITWHFRNKDDILRAVLDDAIAEIDSRAFRVIRSEAKLADRVRAVVREMVQSYASDAGQVLLAFFSRGEDSPDVHVPMASTHAALFARYRAYSRDLVRIGQQRGEFRPDADADAVAAVIVGLVVGIAVQALADGMGPPESWVVTAGDAVVCYVDRVGRMPA